MKHKQMGFTLIELVIVIVILGILATTVAPKFIGLSADARASVMKAVEGAMRSTNTIIYARAASQGKTTLIDDPGGTRVQIKILEHNVATIYGYAADMDQLVEAMYINEKSNDKGFSPKGEHFKIVESGGLERLEHIGAKDGSKCKITYTPAKYENGILLAPKYNLNISDCS